MWITCVKPSALHMGNVILEQFDGIICEYHVNSNVKPLELHIKTYGIT